jgi:putative SOS response-associated peptidase YedK
MCGRFTLTLDPIELREIFDLMEIPGEWTQRFNIAPSQPVEVLTNPDARRIEYFQWGLVPSWAKDPSIGSRLINARSETIAEKPSFRSALARRRCLILADGFYEWKKMGGKTPSMPYYFKLKDNKPFAFAGLWEQWQTPEGNLLKSCTIITCPANELVGSVHDRMPVMFDAVHSWLWLGKLPQEDLLSMLQPYPAHLMTAYPVGRNVNSPTNDDPGLIQSVS